MGMNQPNPLGRTIEVTELEDLVKGELVVGDGTGAPQALTVGADTFVLTADSAEVTGVKWAAAGAGGGDMTAATYDPATIAEQLVGLTASQTLTNKVLTAPDINGGTADSLTSLSVRSTGASFDMIQAMTEAIGADRTLTWTLNDADRAVSLGGNVTIDADFSTSGGSATLTVTGPSNVTLPTTGTLATLAGTETFTNKVITSPDIDGGTLDGAAIGGSTPSTGIFTGLSASVSVNALLDTLTSSGTDFGIRMTQTLNDGAAPSGGEVYTGLSVEVTQTDVTGWNKVTLMEASVDTVSVFSLSAGGVLSVTQAGGTPGTDALSIQHDGQDMVLQNLDSTGGYSFLNSASSEIFFGDSAGFSVSQQVQTTGSPNALLVTGAAHTTLTASTEAIGVDLDLSATVQFATGALATQRAVRIAAPTYAFVGASTLTDAATLYVSGAPIAGTNATITNAYAFWADAGVSRFDGRILGAQGADVASGTNITLGADGNTFEITGTTKVDLISNIGWTEGSQVTLVANESVTIDSGTATSSTNVTIKLAGGVDFAMTADDTLTLKLCSTTAGGQAWREISRSAN